MTHEVDFLAFANDTSAAVTDQPTWAGYAAGGAVQYGFPAGILQGADLNKAIRQSSVMTAALANLVSSTLGQDVLDSGGAASVTALISQLLATITAIAGVPTGVAAPYLGSVAPAGWVLAAGGSIGSATSGASARANADAAALYSLLWTLPSIALVSGGKGSTAVADFNAERALVLPDFSGRSFAGLDNMSGAARGVLAGATSIGALLGEQTHTLSQAELPNYALPVTDPGHVHPLTYGQDSPTSGGGSADFNYTDHSKNTGSATTGVTVHSGGSGTAHNNVQPTYCGYWIVKL